MIILDTETTGLPGISLMPVDSQPRIIELSAMKVDEGTLDIMDELTFLVNPGVPIPAKVTEITGITEEMVAGESKFVKWVIPLTDFFLGERTLVAHNLSFDRLVLAYELTRLDRLLNFPWPPNQVCTVERSQDLEGHYLTLTELYVHYFATDPAQEHRGAGDVAILYEVVKAMRKESRL